MKKKIFSIIAFCFAILSIFTFAGCGVTLSGGPSATDIVTGNGSMSVRKGDYLYFVNGYVSNSSLTGSDNNYGVARNGAIYRAKLENGKLMYETTEDEDGEEIKTLTNVELMVPMVAGFEYTNLYIFGNTLYFTSPNTEKDTTGTIRFDLTNIYAVSLKGGSPKKLVNALNVDSVNDFDFTEIDNKLYLTYINESNLYVAKISGGNVQSNIKVTDKASEFVVDKDSGFVYYTRSFNEGENSVTGNVLAKANLSDAIESVVIKDNYNTYSLKEIKNNKLYYTRTNSLTTNAYIYSQDLNNLNTGSEKQYTAVSYTSNQYIFDLGEGYTNGVIVNENDKLQFLTGIENLENIINLYDAKFTIFGIYGENIYGLDNDNNIVRVNVQTKDIEVLVSGVEVDSSMKVNFDYENGYIYYYVKYTGSSDASGYYLNRTYINQQDKETELVGVLLKEHNIQE
ncbi:MAG: hypothetical protein E7359_03345 [Clostridiales bacterium]|nr:hypothetical protein [Clostridiales bacterium]